MNCSQHGMPLVWKGDFLTGGLMCPKCEEAEHNARFAQLQNESRDAVLEDNGVWMRNGVWVAECCICGERTEFYGDINELAADFLAGEEYTHYCGGSPRCCP